MTPDPKRTVRFEFESRDIDNLEALITEGIEREQTLREDEEPAPDSVEASYERLLTALKGT